MLGGGRGMKIEFSPDADILSIQVSDRKVDHAEEAGPFIIHLAEDGEPVSIEILSGSQFIAQSMSEMLNACVKELERTVQPSEVREILKASIIYALGQFPVLLEAVLAGLKQTARSS
jgi:uncharacterized protein YuzE